MQDWDARGEALIAPAAARNRAAILTVLRDVLPETGTILELASGSGEHVVHFAAALPALTWQPSDPQPACRRSIAAHVRAAGLANVRPPLDCDAASDRWGIAAADAVLCLNMVHIAPWAATEGLMAGSARVLPTGGALVLYGAFREGGRHTTDSNVAFDAALRRQDPRWGVRDREAVARVAEGRGLVPAARIALPANNLALVFRKDSRASA